MLRELNFTEMELVSGGQDSGGEEEEEEEEDVVVTTAARIAPTVTIYFYAGGTSGVSANASYGGVGAGVGVEGSDPRPVAEITGEDADANGLPDPYTYEDVDRMREFHRNGPLNTPRNADRYFERR